MMTHDDAVLDTALTVDQITARFPQAIAVLNRFGIDMCCGGGVSLEEAARRDGASLAEVREALRAVLPQEPAGRSA